MKTPEPSADEYLPRVYEELHGLAGRMLYGAGRGHTLQATALVHEAYLRLAGGSSEFESKRHFFRVAARAMRAVLVNYARDRGRLKRGGDRARVTLGTEDVAFEANLAELLTLDEALEHLARSDQELAQVVELRFFSGLTVQESADVLGLSVPTVERRWRVARALLREEMRGDEGAEP